MKQVHQLSHITYEVKKSKFIAYLIPFHKFKSTLNLLKKNNPKARHFVYAYRILNKYNQIEENQSDDGEPKNSSGKPALSVLRGNNLINSAVIIVRYFGGIKLGVGGLIRAYTNSVNQVINNCSLENYLKKCDIDFIIPYTYLKKVEHLLKSYSIENLNKTFQEKDVLLEFKINESELDEIKKLLMPYQNKSAL